MTSYFRKNVKFQVVEALMSLSSKYMIDELRLEVVEHLRSLFPDTLEAFTSRYSSFQNTPKSETIIGAITIGREYQIMDILPSAFLLSFDLPLETIWDGVPSQSNESKIYRLSTQDLRTYHLARESIFSPTYNVLSFLSGEPASDCMKNVDSCRRALQEMGDCSFQKGYLREIETVYAEEFLDPGMFVENESFCHHCKEWWIENLKDSRDHLWQSLPGILGLPDWDQLRPYVPT